MIYNNTTDVSDKLIAYIANFVCPKDIELNEIVIRHKMEGNIHGQWGWHYPDRKKVVIIVPRSIPEQGYRFTTKYAKIKMVFYSRVEFIVAILAHEMRHAYQHQFKYRNNSKVERELDAEYYEEEMLDKWRFISNCNKQHHILK